MSDKKVEDVAPHFPKDAHYYLTQPAIDRAMPVELLLQHLLCYDLNIITQTNHVKDALIAAISNAKSDDLILVTGSTFVVADAIVYLKS